MYKFALQHQIPIITHCIEGTVFYNGEVPDFKNLKICLAHFGGENEWKKYMSDGWNNYNKNICHDTKEVYERRKNTLNHGNQKTIWWNASWVICYLMI